MMAHPLSVDCDPRDMALALKAHLPSTLYIMLKKMKQRLIERRESMLTPQETFTRIYLEDRWDDGQKAQLNTKFYSGPGSAEEFGRPYAARVGEFIAANDIRSVVDLGCGDFRVGSLIATHAAAYVGVDVVKPVVTENQKRFGNERISFRHLDIITDELPDGDLCLVRQVFQHLSNSQIQQVIQKLGKYRWVIVTEDHPGPVGSFAPNVDKAHGTGSRIEKGTGIVLAEPPFELRGLAVFLDIPAPEITRRHFSPDARLVSTLISRTRATGD